MRWETPIVTRILPLTGMALVALFALAGCGPAQKANADEEAAINVSVENPIVRPMEEVIEVHGNLAPRAMAQVVSEVSGEILALYVQEGDEVKAGQPLAHIDDQEYRLSLQQSESAYRVAKSDYESTRELFNEGMKSRSEFEKMKRSFDDATSNLQMQRIRVNNCEVRSPIAGIITERKVELHQMVGTMEQMFTVHDVTSFKLDITVTEKEVARLKEGQEVRIRVDAISTNPDDFPLVGQVSHIQPQVDPQTGTVQVEITLPNPGGGVRSGMFSRLRIVTNVHQNAMVIPRTAITEDEGSFVWLVQNNGVRMTQVKTGLMDEHGIEIIQGLNPGDRVVVEGQSALSAKSKINIIKMEERSAPATAPAAPAPVPAAPSRPAVPAAVPAVTPAPAAGASTPGASPQTGATGAEGNPGQ